MSDQQGGYPAGWYPLPDGTRERYWNGTAWTDSVRPLGGAAVPPPPPGAPTFGAPAPGQPYGTPMYGVQAPHHGPAIASMVLGIVSFVVCYFGLITAIVGLILGLTSLKHVQPRGPKRGRGMAIAGIVCSAVFLALAVLVVVVAIALGNSDFN